jgi:hypothetical protein
MRATNIRTIGVAGRRSRAREKEEEEGDRGRRRRRRSGRLKMEWGLRELQR